MDTPELGLSQRSDKEVKNVFEDMMPSEPMSANDETMFDLEEMKRIERILKQQK